MPKYSYSVEVLEVVISRCNLMELGQVSTAVKKEIRLYKIIETKKLLDLLAKRYECLISPKDLSASDTERGNRLHLSYHAMFVPQNSFSKAVSI